MRRLSSRIMSRDDPRLADFIMLARLGRGRGEMASMLGVDATTITKWAGLTGVLLASRADSMRARWHDPDFRRWRAESRSAK